MGAFLIEGDAWRAAQRLVGRWIEKGDRGRALSEMPCYCLGSELTGSAGSVTGSAGCCPLLPKRLGTERSGLPAEPVVKGRGGELLGGTLYELAPRYEGVPLPDLSTLTVSAPTLMPCTR